MIDFRYHLVSLISVFMALAVGIVLGAGPLKESIGDALTGEVEELRSRSTDLRQQLDAARSDLDQAERALTDVAPSLLEGTLEGRRVAVVQVGEVTEEVSEAVVERLAQAGATVTARAQLADLWTDPAQQSFRGALAGTLLDHLDPVPPDDAGSAVELAEGLVQGLTSVDPTDPDALTESAGNLLALLGDAELVTFTEEVTVPADHVVVLAGPVLTLEEAQAEVERSSAEPEEDQRVEEERVQAVVDAGAVLATVLAERTDGAVVAGGELFEPSVVRSVRQEGTDVSTVDSLTSTFGPVAVPLAIANAVVGTAGHYGTGAGAEVVLPSRTVAPVIERVASAPPEGQPGSTDGTGDGTTGDGTAGDGTTGDGTTGDGTTSDGDATTGDGTGDATGTEG